MRNLEQIRDFRVLDRDIADFDRMISSRGKYEETLFIASDANRALAIAQAGALTKRISSLPTGDPVFEVLAGHFRDYIDDVMHWLDGSNDNIGQKAHSISWWLYSLCKMDYRPEDVRARVFASKLKHIPMWWNDGLLPLVAVATPSKLRDVLFGLNQVLIVAEDIRPDLEASFGRFAGVYAIDALLGQFIETIRDYVTHVGKLIESKGGVPNTQARADGDTVNKTHDEYRAVLTNRVGVDLDEVLEWYESENEKTRAEQLELALRLDLSVKSAADVSKMLFQHAGPCDNPKEMFERGNSYLQRARAAAHDYIWLPEDEVCEITEVPKHLKDSYPWGGYNADYPSCYPLYNVMFLNNYNYNNVTDGWLKLQSLHEAYPGHHAQFLRCAIDPIPETMKRGAKSTAFTEGVCIRTERTFEYVFPEDPYYPLMVAHRRHHTSTRIKVDLWLNYFGKTIGEACDLYEKEMGFDRKTARAQVQAHESMFGYFTGYYYGVKKLEDWEKQYKWAPKEYTKLLFSVGRPSLDTFEKILMLSPEDRHSLLHDFASMMQFA